MAPSARSVHKAEAKYGVTADYLDLQLHSAAANGNVGLVKYALMHGQPVNSVLNGVLPIHIAAASGNELVVQMLIDAGADVNAARLPRKYNADRAKAVNSIGAAGSTPLHFAAANGHSNVVSLLLTHGADPEIREKHGLTPEDLAREGGHVNVITVLRIWRGMDPAERASPSKRTPLDRSDTASIISNRRPSSSDSPTRRGLPSFTTSSSASIKDLGRTATSNSALSTSKRILGKPSFDSISSKGKKLAKAASNPNLAGLLHPSHAAAQSSHSTSASPHLSPATIINHNHNNNHTFAPTPTALRQDPSSRLTASQSTNSLAPASRQQTGRSTVSAGSTSYAPGTSHLHHIIRSDKVRRPSLPSVFEKAAHPSQSIRSALGMTPANPSGSTTSAFSIHRANSSSSQINDPFHLTTRPKRSSSKASLSSVFRHGSHHHKDKSDSGSLPLSPAASSFFTGDDELEQAERDAFLRATDRELSSGEETYHQHGHNNNSHLPYRQAADGSQHPVIGRRRSTEGLHNGRSRAGSGSSAASSGPSLSVRGQNNHYPSSSRYSTVSAHSQPYPTTAPPTQSSFFPTNPSSASSTPDLTHPGTAGPRPYTRTNSSSISLVIPAPIPPPPSSSNQPFFSKAAISAAHNNPAIHRPGFYRPRKSSQLSTAASVAESVRSNGILYSPDADGRSVQTVQSPTFEDLPYDQEGGRYDLPPDGILLAAPSVVVRKPTIQETYGPTAALNRSHSSRSGARTPTTPRSPMTDGTVSPQRPQPLTMINKNPNGAAQPTTSRHSRASSDGAGTLRASTSSSHLPDVHEAATTDLRQRSMSAGPQYTPTNEVSNALDVEQDTDSDVAREKEDTFPTDQERPFVTRSRAGSRARADTVSSNASSVPYSSSSSGAGHPTSPSAPPPQPSIHNLAQHHQQPLSSASSDAGDHGWAGMMTRPGRSESIGTDTRTSRSGSTGEGPGHASRFFGFDYSSSPASTSSFHYQPSHSTTATSLVSSPPLIALQAPGQPREGEGLTVTHAQAQSMVKKKEEELLKYDPSSSNVGVSGVRRPSLSQQLAAYGESLSIEKELSDAEKNRKHPGQPITLTIPNPPQSAKYSWEILGKESRTTMPITKGQRAKDDGSKGPVQKLWTHKMVSPFEVPLNRPGGSSVPGHKQTASTSTISGITSSGKSLLTPKAQAHDLPTHKLAAPAPSEPTSPVTLQGQTAAIHAGTKDVATLRSKPSNLSNTSTNTYLAPPIAGGGSDLSIHRKSPRLASVSPARSPRTSVDKERVPSTTYHFVAGPRSEPTDSASSSNVSEPRSSFRHHSHHHHHNHNHQQQHGTGGGSGSTASTLSAPIPTSRSHQHRPSRPDASTKLLSHSPEVAMPQEETPRAPQILRLETVMAPKFHVEQKAGGLAAPSPTKNKFSSKFGKLFKG